MHVRQGSMRASVVVGRGLRLIPILDPFRPAGGSPHVGSKSIAEMVVGVYRSSDEKSLSFQALLSLGTWCVPACCQIARSCSEKMGLKGTPDGQSNLGTTALKEGILKLKNMTLF